MTRTAIHVNYRRCLRFRWIIYWREDDVDASQRPINLLVFGRWLRSAMWMQSSWTSRNRFFSTNTHCGQGRFGNICFDHDLFKMLNLLLANIGLWRHLFMSHFVIVRITQNFVSNRKRIVEGQVLCFSEWSKTWIHHQPPPLKLPTVAMQKIVNNKSNTNSTLRFIFLSLCRSLILLQWDPSRCCHTDDSYWFFQNEG